LKTFELRRNARGRKRQIENENQHEGGARGSKMRFEKFKRKPARRRLSFFLSLNLGLVFTFFSFLINIVLNSMLHI
jgi:hypothetical protein